jgi:tetratricopeptide (TPR) repeat protein
MRKNLFLFCPLLLGSVGMLLVKHNNPIFIETVKQPAASVTTIGCGPVTDAIPAMTEDGGFISILPGWGTHTYAITTNNDSAQLFFNQGLSMYYSYHMREAIASFREAARLDSTCAMAYWGQALAMGPTYNGGYDYKMAATVPSVLEAMNKQAGSASAKEQRLIKAMNKRYNPADAADKERAHLNVRYAEALKEVVAAYAEDQDIKALYVDAVMLVHPWEFWNNDGSPKPWTPELVQYCEDILAKAPQHPAALHYYIHVTEASRRPEVALFSADSLLKLYPGVAHMVHMSSHQYERTGKYEKGVKANEAADRSLGQYDALAKNLSLPAHVSHYFAVDAYCALSGAMYKKGLPKAIACRKSANPSPENTYQQYLYMFPLFALVRMGKWQEILADTSAIDPAWTYAGLLNDFARGMAYSKTSQPHKAEMHLAQLREKMRDSLLRKRFTPYMSSAYEVALVAENILAAMIRYNQKDYKAALRTIRKAIRAEDSLLYIEPKLWMIPARQYLGVFLLELKKPAEAEKIYREDLVWNPGNGWSLLGLYQALWAQEKKGELAKLFNAYRQSFSAADTMPPGSAY